MENKTTTFIEKARTVHGDRYDYSKVDYNFAKEKVIIICKSHGEFLVQPNAHLSSRSGCPIYANNTIINNKQFIEKAKNVHGDRYDYSKVDYKRSQEKVKIICKVHGEFLQTPGNHINVKAGCPNCVNNRLMNTEYFIKNARAIHGDYYDYSLVDYKGLKEKVIIIY